ncbi:hypothetical protein [Roseisolibacter sp. H3M3-2]|uniref:hypothetical protein n=1 Tax=Roseisolibacter sp. H3M3-2 TaxID=3031323 RepID=UPI0023DC19D3|nr:hypothetical protein [Roseisolibacter sp. H3M3-2]MDF1504601.1 hypothetical protein [Roseisolibacter sp. H3M3-2]
MLRTLVLAAALVAAVPASRLAAQEQVVNPVQLDPASPRAKLAKEAADAVLGGDRAKLDAWLKEHGTATVFTENLDRLLEITKTGARTILRFDDLPSGNVGVVLAADANAEPERAIIVMMEKDAPHKVTRLGLGRLSTGG